jgi:virginiamycin B lyase
MRRTTLIVAAAVLAGCGGSDRDATTRRAQPTTTSTAERTPAASPARVRLRLKAYPVPAGSHPHDVAPAPDGRRVWYTAQHTGKLGLLDPRTGDVEEIPLGSGSAPHGVIVGPGGAAWVTDGGLDAIVRVDARTHRVRVFPLPADRPDVNLNTATFSGRRVLWFTGQSGIYGRLDTRTGRMRVFDAPRGGGPYGIDATPSGEVYYASLAGSYLGHIDRRTGRATVLDPPTPEQGARRVWSDSKGRLWISEYVAGRLGRYDPATRRWREWKLPGDSPQPYAIYVDDRDVVWLSDFTSNRLVRFHRGRFRTYPWPADRAAVRQILGRPGELWGAQSGADSLVVAHTNPN